MRDFIWFFILTIFMYAVGDHYTTQKTVHIAHHELVEQAETVAANPAAASLILADEALK